MTDEFTNRFTMFEIALGVLNSDDFKGVWHSDGSLASSQSKHGLGTLELSWATRRLMHQDIFCRTIGLPRDPPNGEHKRVSALAPQADCRDKPSLGPLLTPSGHLLPGGHTDLKCFLGEGWPLFWHLRTTISGRD